MPEKVDSIDGRLPDVKKQLFVVPSVLNFHIKAVILVNTNEALAVTAELWIARKGSLQQARRIMPKISIAANADAQEHGVFIPLRSGDVIEGKASVGDSVDYFIAYCAES